MYCSRSRRFPSILPGWSFTCHSSAVHALYSQAAPRRSGPTRLVNGSTTTPSRSCRRRLPLGACCSITDGREELTFECCAAERPCPPICRYVWLLMLGLSGTSMGPPKQLFGPRWVG